MSDTQSMRGGSVAVGIMLCPQRRALKIGDGKCGVTFCLLSWPNPATQAKSGKLSSGDPSRIVRLVDFVRIQSIIFAVISRTHRAGLFLMLACSIFLDRPIPDRQPGRSIRGCRTCD